MRSKIQNNIRKSLILSSRIIVEGRNVLNELINSLEDNGLSKVEARQTAFELFDSMEKTKDSFVKTILKKNNKQ